MLDSVRLLNFLALFQMKLPFVSAFLFACACSFVMGATGSDRIADVDPGYDVEQVIKKGRDKNLASAREKFDNDPRESTLRLTFAPSLLFGMHGDLSGGDGWGANASILVQANSDTPDFKFLVGGELLAFTAERDSGGDKLEMNTLNLMLSIGFAYDFGSHFAMGVLWGYGVVGATHIEENFSDGDSETSGTMSTVLSFKPYAEFMLNKNFSVYAAYRFTYVGSSIISKAADWGEVEMAGHAVEFGCSYRF